jgi:hypothetical protein
MCKWVSADLELKISGASQQTTIEANNDYELFYYPK